MPHSLTSTSESSAPQSAANTEGRGSNMPFSSSRVMPGDELDINTHHPASEEIGTLKRSLDELTTSNQQDEEGPQEAKRQRTCDTSSGAASSSNITGLNALCPENADPWIARLKRDFGRLPATGHDAKTAYQKACDTYFEFPIVKKFDFSWLKSTCLQDFPERLMLSEVQQQGLVDYLSKMMTDEGLDASAPSGRPYLTYILSQLCQLLTYYVSDDSRKNLFKQLEDIKTPNLNASAWSMLLGLPLSEMQFKQDLAADAISDKPFGYHLGHWAASMGCETGLSYFLNSLGTTHQGGLTHTSGLDVTTPLGNESLVNVTTNDGMSPLHLAARNGHVACIEALLKAGADINAKSNHGCSPLHLAAQHGHVACIEVLLQAGADINAKSNDGWSPLHLAAYNGHAGCIEALLRAGADINAKSNHGCSPLHLASQNGHVACIEALLRAGANVNITTNDGRSPLHLAARNGHVACIEALLRAGANVNAKANDGWSPLHQAAHNGHAGCIEALLRAGANPYGRKVGDGPAPAIEYAASLRQDKPAMLDAFLRSGVPVVRGMNLPSLNAAIETRVKLRLGKTLDELGVELRYGLAGLLHAQPPRVQADPCKFPCLPYDYSLNGISSLEAALEGDEGAIADLANMPEPVKSVFLRGLHQLAELASDGHLLIANQLQRVSLRIEAYTSNEESLKLKAEMRALRQEVNEQRSRAVEQEQEIKELKAMLFQLLSVKSDPPMIDITPLGSPGLFSSPIMPGSPSLSSSSGLFARAITDSASSGASSIMPKL